jgi:signal transduction histidine kinase
VIERSRRLGKEILAKPALLDFLLFVLMALSLAAEFMAFRADFEAGLSSFQLKLWFGLTVPVVLMVLVRRLAPFAVLVGIAAIQLALILLLTSDWLPSTLEWCLYIAIFTVASRRTPRWAGAAVVLATLTQIPLRASVRCPCIVQLFTFLTLAAIAGFSLQAGRRLIGELRWQAGLLQRTRGERVKLALTQQRSQVARDLHDVVAHGVTVMVVQAGAARMVAPKDPRQAEQILARVETVAGEAARELRSMVDSLGADEEGFESPPTPQGLENLLSLVEHERAMGADVNLTVVGEPGPLDSAMGLSLFRIAQESLTNARRHAPGAAVEVMLRYLPDAVEIEVANGRGRAGTGPGPVSGFGRGLIGVRERAALFGGEASAGPTPDAGYRVLARLPFQLVPA